MSYIYGGYPRSYGNYPPSYYSPSRSYTRPYYGSPRGDSWVERIPVEQRYTEYVPEQRVEYRPVERTYRDYIEVEHRRDYVPVPRVERRVDYVPVERFDERVDYMPVQRSSVVRSPERAYNGRQSRYSYSYPSRYYY